MQLFRWYFVWDFCKQAGNSKRGQFGSGTLASNVDLLIKHLLPLALPLQWPVARSLSSQSESPLQCKRRGQSSRHVTLSAELCATNANITTTTTNNASHHFFYSLWFTWMLVVNPNKRTTTTTRTRNPLLVDQENNCRDLSSKQTNKHTDKRTTNTDRD